VLSAPGRRGAALAAAVLTLGLATGAAASTSVALADRRATAAELGSDAGAVRAALDSTLRRYADTLADVAARAAATPATATPPPADRLPGAHRLAVVGPDLAVRARLILDGTTPPAETRLRPDPALRRTLDTARTTGRLVAGPPHVLPGDRALPPDRRQAAFDLVQPVPGPRGGWVVVSVRTGDLLDAALRPVDPTGVTVTLTAPGSGPAARWPASAAPGANARSISADLGLAGGSWQVVVQSATTAPATALITMLVAAGGSLLAAALTLAARRPADDTARIAAEQRAAAAEQATRERAAELAGLAAAAVDNLQAPLHAVAGFTELLREEAPGLDPAARGFVERIGHSTDRMLRTVEELRSYTSSADAALRPEPVDVERLALDVVASMLDRHTGPAPRVDVGELPVVTADAALLRQVLEHLVDNAVRFVRHGGAAQVRISAAEADAGWWRIEVADRGIGVPEEHRHRIFAPFHRTPAADGYPGAGLGLGICRRIVAMHGGEIGVAANPGGGSVFHFTVSAAGLTVPDLLAELTAP
jgi:signal transduction histidine kinase